MTPPVAVPATLVIGLAGAGKSAYIRAQLAHRPAGESWLWLNNDLPLDPPDPRVQVTDLTVGCACCAALPVLRTRVPHWLAERRYHRVLIELASAGDPCAIVDALRMPELARWLTVSQVVLVADARHLVPGPVRPAGSAVALLAARQLEAADRVWLTRHQQLPRELLQPLAAQLAASPPFGRPVYLAGCGSSPDILCPRPPDWAGATPPPLWQRRWPADWRFDRRRLLALIDDSAGWPARMRIDAVFGTERAWYRIQRQAARLTTQVSAYRSENRLQVCLEPAQAGYAETAACITGDLGERLTQLVPAIEATRLA